MKRAKRTPALKRTSLPWFLNPGLCLLMMLDLAPPLSPAFYQKC